MSLPKAYVAKDYEDKIYSKWLDNDCFKPSGKGEPYSIVLPPPNATGQLHIGHAVMIAIEDTLVRRARMQGKNTLWVPGTDHAAIATENVVIQNLIKQGTERPREELGREKLVEEIKKFVEQSRSTINSQIKATGASVDWSRERYTMDDAQNMLVNKVFVKMYNDGLIYRGNRIVNWDPKLETNVSDDEVEHKTETTRFYTLKYGPFHIGTARPETKFGDKYIVMHPDDERYKDWKHGQTFEADWINGKVTATVIKDEAIDPEFGTGVMTITPWHDHTDFEIAERHNLEAKQIINLDGTLTDAAGRFIGMDINEARPLIAEELKKLGLLIETDDTYTHNIAVNERGGGVIEPQIREQWFIDVNKPVVEWKGKKQSLKAVMQDAVASKDINIIPEHFEKIYFNWVDNLRDWCISRQIWWGHQVPAWYKDDEVYVDLHPPMVNKKHDPHRTDGNQETGWKRDPDTLDTWFSSGLWSWSTLVDQELAADPNVDLDTLLKKSPEFKTFHPTTVLETGYDIIFFWVARMILMTTYVTGEIPFKDVYLHGLVLTRDGQKMSKSKPETTIDPLEIIPSYGADALRLSMMIGQTPGNNNRLYREKIAGYRNFCNKMWNVGRYILDNVTEEELYKSPEVKSSADVWIFNKIQSAIADVSQGLDEYRISDAGQVIYRTLWDDFADWYIEASKTDLNGPLLAEMFRTLLKLAHPMAPFVTEALWDKFDNSEQMLAVASWPEPAKPAKSELAQEFEEIINIVNEIRELKSEMKLSETSLYYADPDSLLSRNGNLVVHLTGIKRCKEVVDGYGLHLTKTSVNCWLDLEENIVRNFLFSLIKTRKDQQKRFENLRSRLDNKSYINNAPEDIVKETKNDLEQTRIYIERLTDQVDNLERMIQNT